MSAYLAILCVLVGVAAGNVGFSIYGASMVVTFGYGIESRYGMLHPFLLCVGGYALAMADPFGAGLACEMALAVAWPRATMARIPLFAYAIGSVLSLAILTVQGVAYNHSAVLSIVFGAIYGHCILKGSNEND